MGPTERIARFALSTNYEDIPDEAIMVAKQCILDSLGTMLAGSRERATQIAMRYAKDSGGKPEAGAIGGRFQTSLTNAALINGTSAHALELEQSGMDSGPEGFIVVPVALNAAEVYKRSGKDLLEAVVIGWELMARITLGCYGALKRGFIGPSCTGPLAYAAMLSKLMKLNLDQAVMAIALTADQSGGLVQNNTMCHFLESGFAARNAVTAALLAKEGMKGQADVIEGIRGFWELFCGDDHDEETIFKNLGNPFYFVSPGVMVKKYGCCGYIHSPLDALFQLMKEHNIHYDEIDKVEVNVHPHARWGFRILEPRDGAEAKLSVPHALGAAMLDGKVDLRTFSDMGAADPRYKEARNKVDMIVREDWASKRAAATPVPTTIKLKDGRVYSKTLSRPQIKGSKDNPLSREEFIARYKMLAGVVLNPTQVRRSIELVDHLENLEDISELMELVTFAGRAKPEN
jgi:2-methylcitrate dehydratase PrpD